LSSGAALETVRHRGAIDLGEDVVGEVLADVGDLQVVQRDPAAEVMRARETVQRLRGGGAGLRVANQGGGILG
jgi:hypothetical protein